RIVRPRGTLDELRLELAVPLGAATGSTELREVIASGAADGRAVLISAFPSPVIRILRAGVGTMLASTGQRVAVPVLGARVLVTGSGRCTVGVDWAGHISARGSHRAAARARSAGSTSLGIKAS